MDLVRGLEALPLANGPSAVTVGFFDGIHLGHQAVIGRTVEAARSRSLEPVAVTFDRHPREIYAAGTEPPLLTTLERKAALIDGLGVGTLLVLEFTRELSLWPPADFAVRVLARGLHASHVVVGSNFTFGFKAEGKLETLAELGTGLGFTVEGMGLLEVDGRTVSSSSIRGALAAGDLDWPALALGRRYVLDGRVVDGAGRGAGLGFPTANLAVRPKLLLPADGVYAGRALTGKGAFAAAINVGTNPTFGKEPRHVEAFLLGFAGDLYGKRLVVELWRRLRDERAFGSEQELIDQIARDVADTEQAQRPV